MLPRSGLEASLILNRVSARVGGAESSEVMDTARLALELRRHERRRQMMRHLNDDYDDEEEHKREGNRRRRVLNAAKERNVLRYLLRAVPENNFLSRNPNSHLERRRW